MSNSKLPKFLQKQTNRERSNSKSEGADDLSIVIEPVRTRSRSERPDNSHIGDLPTRLSGWFQHTFSTSSTDLSTLLAQQAASPKGKGPNAFLTAAKHGKGHLDKAMRYLLDSDATPDKSTDPIWLLGVQHIGYEPPQGDKDRDKKRRGSTSSPSASLRSSTSSPIDPLSQSTSSLASVKQSSSKPDPSAYWPAVFYLDFTSRVWLTYRSQFPLPIRDGRLADLCQPNWEETASSPVVTGRRAWPWGGEKTWSSDTGWGCMLRTGQSLLANALIHVHLGRDWRRPPHPVQTADYATYVQILTWFLDTPSPDAPFSVHRMALAGKEYGTDVGQWFGPSVAAGAIRTLLGQYPECGLAVSVATDSILYQSQVFAASNGDTDYRSPRRSATKTWGDRPVLLLLGIRLGIEGVNPIYYETIKRLYEFPQSVGIAGGRPSSSYYFVGSQGDNLFYLDPHHTRPAIPLRHPSSDDESELSEPRSSFASNSNSDFDSAVQMKKSKPLPVAPRTPAKTTKPRPNPSYHHRTPTSPSSTRTGSSSISSMHAPTSPSPLQQQLSTSSADSSYSTTSSSYQEHRSPPPSYSAARAQTQHNRYRSASHSQPGSPRITSPEMEYRELGIHGSSGPSLEVNLDADDLDPTQRHFCTAYSDAELRTFHCERIRKMHLSGLDPSMLLGFLCRNESEWWDFRKRVGELPKTIFSVQDEPPTWPSDSDDNMGLESMSEPDDFDLNDDEEVEVEADVEEDNDIDEPFFDTQSAQSASASSRSHAGRSDKGNKSEEIDTEDDPVGPMTPGPGSRFEIIGRGSGRRRQKGSTVQDSDEEDEEDSANVQGGDYEDVEGDDIEDDWIDPSIPTPTPRQQSSSILSPPTVPEKDKGRTSKDRSPSPPSSSNVPPLAKSKSSSEAKTKSSKSRKKTMRQTPVPVPAVKIPQQEHYPFPVTPADDGGSSPRNGDRSRQTSATRVPKQPRMHTTRARDGGRTQSGGVKGILPSDST